QAYGVNYQRPGGVARILGFLYRLLPKVGPLKRLAFKAPTAETERLFVTGFGESRARYAEALIADQEDRLDLQNTDLDTGKAAQRGEYSLADETYATLLERLVKIPSGNVPIALCRNIRAFYAVQPKPSLFNKRERKRWERIERALVVLPQ